MKVFGFYILSGNQMDYFQEREKKAKEYKKKFEDLNMSFSKRKTEWDAEKKVLTAKVESYEEQMAGKDRELINMGNDNAECKSRIQDLKDKQRKLIASVKEKSNEITDLEKRIETADEALEKRQEELTEALNQLAEANKKIEELEASLKEKEDVPVDSDSEQEAQPETEEVVLPEGENDVESLAQTEVEEAGEEPQVDTEETPANETVNETSTEPEWSPEGSERPSEEKTEEVVNETASDVKEMAKAAPSKVRKKKKRR